LQAIIASLLLQSRVGRLDWPDIAVTGGKTLLATALMSVVCVGILKLLPQGESLGPKLAAVVVPMSLGVGVFLLIARVVRLNEPWELTGIAQWRRA